MKHLIILTGLFFLLSSFLPARNGIVNTKGANIKDFAYCVSKNTTFNSNEELTYKVFYNWNFVWIPAGFVDFSATETTYAGKPSYLFKATGKTIPTYDPIYKVRDYYHAYVDKESMKPMKYVRDTDEGGYTTYEELRFDYGSNKINSKKGKSKDDVEEKTFALKDCTFDVVSIMYHMRNIDLENRKVGEKIPMNIFFGEKQYDLYVKYLGTDEVKVKGQGKFNCHKLSPLLIEGKIFTETDQMKVWVTADDNKLPVMIESPIRVGSIKAIIESAENLKYPIEAKL